MNMMYKGFFVDDSERDKGIGENLSIAGKEGMEVEFIKPELPLVELAEKLLSDKPDLVALDYRLDEEREKEDAPNRYKAGPLAQYLRDNALDSTESDFPIILVSHEHKIKKYFEPDLTVHDLFDRHYTKQEIVKEPDRCRREILSLARGYKQLIGIWDKQDRLYLLVGLNEDDKAEIDQQPLRELNALKAPHQVIRNIFRYFIDRSGILLDLNNLLASLGISPDSKNLDKLLSVLNKNGITYTGIFGKGWERWWNYRLHRLGQELCSEHLGYLTAEQRVLCLNENFGLKLIPAKSKWTGRTDAMFAFACASCRQPTEMEFSVAAYEPLPHPGLIHPKRICWKCVQTGEYQNIYPRLSVHEDDLLVANKIEHGEIKGEG